MPEMTDTEKVDAIRELLSRADLHRNREKRETLEAIRSMLGVPVEPDGTDAPADDLGEKDASNDSGGTWDDLDDLSRAELNAIAKAAGLDAKGKQADLIARIREHLADEIVSPEQVDAEIAAAEGESEDVEPDADAEGGEDTPEAPVEPSDESEDAGERPGPRVAPDDEE